MPTDPTSIADPQFILLTWAAGLAFASGFVSLARIVGPGFIWMTAPVAAIVSLGGVATSGSWAARGGLVFLVLGAIWARNRPFAGVMLTVAGSLFLVEAAFIGGAVAALSATMALGGVTGEMLLGHWYLLDPSLPRWTLRTLAYAGIAGLAVDSIVLAVGGLPTGGATIAYWVLLATSIVLMAGVLGSLRYPAYSGVMAATGLSYLAVLTTLGAVFLGRALVAGLGPFSN